jgi:hypothetical protein
VFPEPEGAVKITSRHEILSDIVRKYESMLRSKIKKLRGRQMFSKLSCKVS